MAVVGGGRVLDYDNIPQESRGNYRLTGWRERDGERTNVVQKVGGRNVPVWPSDVPQEWVVE